MYYVYSLLSLKNGDLYIGYTNNLKKRFSEHNQGKVKSTKPNRPWALAYCEAYGDKKDATRREVLLKTGQQRELLRKRLKHFLERYQVKKQ